MDIKYAVFPEERLLIQKFIGEFSHEDYVRHIGKLMQKESIRKVKKILLDFRAVTFVANVKIFEKKLAEMINTRKDMNTMIAGDDQVIRVFWVDKPLPTVVAQLFSAQFPNGQYHFCSTDTVILELLGLSENENYQELEKIVDNIS